MGGQGGWGARLPGPFLAARCSDLHVIWPGRAAADVAARIGHLPDVEDRCRPHTPWVSSSRSPTGALVAGEDLSPSRTGPVSAVVRLVVVDDDIRVRAAITQTIALEGDLLLVGDAADATGALALAERADPSVALVDVLLPDDATGLALVRSLTERRGCAVVAMSVRGGLREAAMAAGAVAFVEKGGDIDALLDAVRSATTPDRVGPGHRADGHRVI